MARLRRSFEDEVLGETTGSEPAPRRDDWAANGTKSHLTPWDGVGPRNDAEDDLSLEHEHLLDPNLPPDERQRRSSSQEGPLMGALQMEEDENSPYPEVRAAVPITDKDLPCNTVRAWSLGLLIVVIGAATNTFFSLRQPVIALGPLVAQVVSYPMGHLWAKVMPTSTVTIFGRQLSLNPGPFNVKEHSIIFVMASVSFSVAYSTDIILAQVVFYKQDFGIWFQMLLTVTTQSLGYGIAGSLRKFLVYPASMIWPETLVAVTLMTAMYEDHGAKDPTVFGGNMSRLKWFIVVSFVSFFYYFIPGFFAQFLSVFAFMTWMAPKNPIVNQLFGGISGLSLIPITFDWTQVSGYVGSPLVPPWHAIANTLISVVVFFVTLSSVLHYSGAWYGQYFPINDANTYDNTGALYNISRILTKDFTLDEEAYANYSPLFLSTTFAVSYGLSFATIPALLVYTYLHNGKQIVRQYWDSTTEKPDVHMRLMRKYKETPTWWFMSLFAAMLVLGFYTVLAYPTNMAWWSFLLAVALAYIFALPIGIIQAITSNQIGLNVLTAFIFGYIQPGKPLALMIFKTFGYITMSQALGFVADLKFGHYMKIPPRTMFLTQVVATTVSCFVQVVVLNMTMSAVDDICDQHQKDRFTCPGGRVFFSASVIWGLIGPQRIFSPGRLYSGLFVFFVLGAILPIAIYLTIKRWPKSPARFLIAPIIFGGAGAMPPATPLNYFSWGIVGFVFQFWIKRYHFRWWSRLNVLTSNALDLGLAVGTLFIFFAFTMQGIDPPKWWGNSVVQSTLDAQGGAVRALVEKGESFGPKSW